METTEKFAGRNLAVLVALLVAAAVLRVWLAMSYPFIFDEKYDWLIEAASISWDRETWNMPVRTARHGALSAYAIRFGAELLPESHLAWRLSSIVAGLVTIWGVAVLGRDRFGARAGLAAAALFAVAEYPVQVSTTAIQMPVYLAASVWAMIWFLRDLDRPRALSVLMTALFSGLAFLAYEIAGLMVLAFFVIYLRRFGAGLFRRPAAWGGAGLFLALIAPDVHANLTAAQAELSYEGFLGKINGLGFNPTYLEMYFPFGTRGLYPVLTGTAFPVSAEEYRPLNDVFGLLVFGGVIWHLRDPRGGVLAGLFAFVFLLFTVIEISPGSYGALWVWVSVTLIPGAVLAGALLAREGAGTFVIRVLFVLAAALSLGHLGLRGFGYPQYALGLNPLYLEDRDGAMVPVSVYVESCDRCAAPVRLTLDSIRELREGEGFGDLPEDAFYGAEIGTDDRGFALRVAGVAGPDDWARRIYAVGYRLEAEGVFIGPHMALAAVRAAGSQIPPRGAPFWGDGDYPP